MKIKIMLIVSVLMVLFAFSISAQDRVIVDVEVDIDINGEDYDDEDSNDQDQKDKDRANKREERRTDRDERDYDWDGAGGGGTFIGWAVPNFDDNGFLISNLPTTQNISSVGGFGYGVDSTGAKVGGFGLAYKDQAFGSAHEDEGILGGAGGLLTGYYGRLGPITLSLNGMFGFGSIRSFQGSETWNFHLLWQGDFEIGIPIFDWFQISAYAGYQGIVGLANFTNNEAQNAYYYPVAGFRLTWGSF